MNQENQPSHNNDDIDLIEIFEKLKEGKKNIVIVTAIFSLLGFLLGNIITPIYQSVIIISPVIQQQQGGSSSMLAQLGPLAQSFGLGNVGQAADDKVALAIYKSKPFSNRLFIDDQLLSAMFKERWEGKNNRWIDGNRPSDISINSRYRRMIQIEQDANTNTIHISFNHENPVFAAQVANKSIDELNDFMREKSIKESEESQKYLNDTLALTNIVDVKNVIYNLIEEQIKATMLASVRKEYIFKVVDYASVPSSPVRPNVTFIMFFFTLFGLMISSIYVYFQGSFSASNEQG